MRNRLIGLKIFNNLSRFMWHLSWTLTFMLNKMFLKLRNIYLTYYNDPHSPISIRKVIAYSVKKMLGSFENALNCRPSFCSSKGCIYLHMISEILFQIFKNAICMLKFSLTLKLSLAPEWETAHRCLNNVEFQQSW